MDKGYMQRNFYTVEPALLITMRLVPKLLLSVFAIVSCKLLLTFFARHRPKSSLCGLSWVGNKRERTAGLLMPFKRSPDLAVRYPEFGCC